MLQLGTGRLYRDFRRFCVHSGIVYALEKKENGGMIETNLKIANIHKPTTDLREFGHVHISVTSDEDRNHSSICLLGATTLIIPGNPLIMVNTRTQIVSRVFGLNVPLAIPYEGFSFFAYVIDDKLRNQEGELIGDDTSGIYIIGVEHVADPQKRILVAKGRFSRMKYSSTAKTLWLKDAAGKIYEYRVDNPTSGINFEVEQTTSVEISHSFDDKEKLPVVVKLDVMHTGALIATTEREIRFYDSRDRNKNQYATPGVKEVKDMRMPNLERKEADRRSSREEICFEPLSGGEAMIGSWGGREVGYFMCSKNPENRKFHTLFMLEEDEFLKDIHVMSKIRRHVLLQIYKNNGNESGTNYLKVLRLGHIKVPFPLAYEKSIPRGIHIMFSNGQIHFTGNNARFLLDPVPSGHALSEDTLFQFTDKTTLMKVDETYLIKNVDQYYVGTKHLLKHNVDIEFSTEFPIGLEMAIGYLSQRGESEDIELYNQYNHDFYHEMIRRRETRNVTGDFKRPQ